MAHTCGHHASPGLTPGAARPTDILREEHTVILRALGVAEALAGTVEAGGALDRSVLAGLVEFLTTFADGCHHGKEEGHLFPAMASHGVPVDGGPIAVMLAEHAEGRRLIAAMKAADATEVAAALRAYARLLRAHIDKENGVLFAIADTVLPADEQARLAAAFGAVEDEEVGTGEHERLLGVLARLEAAAPGVENEPLAGSACSGHTGSPVRARFVSSRS